MSEYWKSTPKYWCKFCKIYVRDTSLEKKQHEQTGKHQFAIQKSLRELHKTQSREEREAQKAKDELKRITGAVDGKPAAAAGPSGKVTGAVASAPVHVSVAKARPTFTREHKLATPEDRKRQAEQLASMGITIPDEFRGDMAIAGEWSTVSVREVTQRPGIKDEGDSDDDKSDGRAIGVKRRKIEDEDEDAEADRASGKRKVWGTTLKSYPGTKGGKEQDFDALLSGTVVKKEVKPEPEDLGDGVKLKKEESAFDEGIATDGIAGDAVCLPGQEESVATADAPVVFKKRKGKR